MSKILYVSCHATTLHQWQMMYNSLMPKGFRKDGTKLGFQKGFIPKSKGKFLKQRIFKICPCGIEFSLSPGQIRLKHGKYCSRICYYKYKINYDVSALSHQLKGKSHWAYKGDKAGYKALHLRVQEQRGKASICEKCKSIIRVEWANLTGKYQDIYDYKALCKKCHNNFDDIYNKGQQTRKKTLYKASETLKLADGGDVTT